VPDDHADNPIDPSVRDLIRRKARRLARRRGSTHQDREDIEQDLVLDLLERLPAFDPDKADRDVFVRMVVSHAVADLLRRTRARKRDDRSVASLGAPLADEGDGPPDLAAAVGRPERDARLGRRPRDDAEQAQLALDLAEVVARLPPALRDLAERLKTRSVSEVARDLGIPRTTLRDRLRVIGGRLERAGLRDYLPRRPSPGAGTG
jgi:RNA polymerase sigma-70 factor (ECF subfamily)